MPRFAANLGYLFAERPLIERFGAAAAAGFAPSSYCFPMMSRPPAVKAELARHGLTQLGINTPVGREGESGLAAIPGREREWEDAFKRALDYAVTIGARSVHCLAGCVPPEAAAGGGNGVHQQISRARPKRRRRPASCC